MLDYIILGFLMGDDLTGYQIKNSMSMSTSFFYDASFGSIYPTLKKLQKKNFIGASSSTSAGKHKITYCIKPKGKEYFLEWLGKPIETDKIKPLFLVKIFFMGFIKKETALFNIGKHIEDVKKHLKVLETLELKDCKNVNYFSLSTLRFGIDMCRFKIDWYENFIKQTKKEGK